jgi:hypothetical protein
LVTEYLSGNLQESPGYFVGFMISICSDLRIKWADIDSAHPRRDVNDRREEVI